MPLRTQKCAPQPSPSPRRAWIEILLLAWPPPAAWVALPTEGVDRNDSTKATISNFLASPSPRRAWIEIKTWLPVEKKKPSPSPRRAWIEIPLSLSSKSSGAVALPAEGVDRNDLLVIDEAQEYGVALPTEGVDRNAKDNYTMLDNLKSPSPRRAWIEMPGTPNMWPRASVALPTEGVDRNLRFAAIRHLAYTVALPTEGVDRNINTSFGGLGCLLSPSPRRAWIEIIIRVFCTRVLSVALPTEGVDRN